jgi:16S rRNA (guanine527-N7)-methyltransferase
MPERPTGASPHEGPLAALGLDDPARAALAAYLDTLAAWSPRVNLTAARTPEERVRLLVAAVLPALALVRPGRLLDVGSGNGSPGLVFALAREDLRATLLEPRAKRWAFLREAARAAGVAARVEAVRARHDEYDGPPADTVTLRALAVPLPALAPLVVPGGRLVVFGVAPTTEAGFVAEAGIRTPRGLHVFRRTA